MENNLSLLRKMAFLGTGGISAPMGWLSQASSNGAYTLWIKSLKKYDVSEVNLLSTINPGVGIFFVWFYSFLSNALQTKMTIIVGQCLFQFAVQFAFVIWKSALNFKWAAVATGICPGCAFANRVLLGKPYSYANLLPSSMRAKRSGAVLGAGMISLPLCLRS